MIDQNSKFAVDQQVKFVNSRGDVVYGTVTFTDTKSMFIEIVCDNEGVVHKIHENRCSLVEALLLIQ